MQNYIVSLRFSQFNQSIIHIPYEMMQKREQ